MVLIEPGLIKTRFGDTAAESIQEGGAATARARTRSSTRPSRRRPCPPTRDRSRSWAAVPDAVAKTIERALASERPKARYPVTPSARIIMTQRRLMPDRVWDRFLTSQFPQPGA